MSMKTRKRYNKTPQRRKIPGVGAETYRGTRVNIVPRPHIDDSPSATVFLHFTKPVFYSGILPLYTGGLDQTVLSVTATTDPTVWQIQMSAPFAEAANYVIPFEDPAFRDLSGGYVQPGSYAVINDTP